MLQPVRVGGGCDLRPTSWSACAIRVSTRSFARFWRIVPNEIATSSLRSTLRPVANPTLSAILRQTLASLAATDGRPRQGEPPRRRASPANRFGKNFNPSPIGSMRFLAGRVLARAFVFQSRRTDFITPGRLYRRPLGSLGLSMFASNSEPRNWLVDLSGTLKSGSGHEFAKRHFE